MIVYTDGGCGPYNPRGIATWGIAVIDRGELIFRDHGYIGFGEGMTCNVAEYHAVIEALKWGYRTNTKGFGIRTDSRLVVQQILGYWNVKAPHLQGLLARAVKGMTICEVTDVKWIPRERNTLADLEARKAYVLARKKLRASGIKV